MTNMVKLFASPLSNYSKCLPITRPQLPQAQIFMWIIGRTLQILATLLVFFATLSFLKRKCEFGVAQTRLSSPENKKVAGADAIID